MEEQETLEILEGKKVTRRGLILSGGVLTAGASVLGGPAAGSLDARRRRPPVWSAPATGFGLWAANPS